MQSPPRRLRLTDELGVTKTPGPGHDIVRTSRLSDWLILGLGPEPAALAASLPPDASVRYLECPAFSEQAGEDWRASIPPHWRAVTCFDPHDDSNVAVSQSALRLFPGFWGPVLAALTLPQPEHTDRFPDRTVFMPASADRLIVREVAEALGGFGYQVQNVAWEHLPSLLKEGRPDLYLSVNFSGLDAYGQAFSLLERAGVPVAVWCVDNPFNALSGLKSQFWKDVSLFVTDEWFIGPLKSHGARNVHHLPLAASPAFFRAVPDAPELAGKLLFVGRSAFPGRDDFFAGLKLPEAALAETASLFARGQRPDFAWWCKRTGVERLWPGKQARLAALGAEETGRLWRTAVIEAAASAGDLVVCGDDAWLNLVGADFSLAPPVDYYGPLAGMYASARCVVGATSPLLPRGLTQRHFDVWAAGGRLISDATPGLELFPRELTAPITYKTPAHLAGTIASLEEAGPGLAQAWRELILNKHTYSHRIRTILERIKA